MTQDGLLKRLWSDEEGGEAVEYGLITALIAVALIGVLWIFRGDIAAMFQEEGEKIQNRPGE